MHKYPHVQRDLPADEVEAVADLIAAAASILFITGAGISAESGLPTYRGIGGLYDNAVTDDEVPIEDALSGPMFRRRPELVWKYLMRMESACRGRHCNDAHRFIAGVEAWRGGVWTLTQNVDGFHREAGSRQLIEIHGDIFRLACLDCDDEREVGSFAGLAVPPHCDCGGLLRPRVVLFGEMLPTDQVARYEAALAAAPQLVFSIGTTSVFPYIAAPVIEAAGRGVPVVEINPGASEVSGLADFRWRSGAVAACRALDAALQRRGAPGLIARS